MCPNNPVGTVDLFMVTHHGLAQSNNDALVQGVRPRVALMQNGTRKGGAIPVFESLRKSPGFEDVWQLHWSYNAGIEHNAPGVFIANVDDAQTIAGVLTAPPGGGRGGRGGGAPGGGAPGGPARHRPQVLRRRPAPAGAPPATAAPATPPAGAAGSRAAGRSAASRRRRNRAPAGRAGWTGRTRWARRPWGWRWWRSRAYAGLLHQGLGAGRRHVHRHQHPQRLQQDLSEAGELVDSDTRLRRIHGLPRRERSERPGGADGGALGPAERRRGESEGRAPRNLLDW